MPPDAVVTVRAGSATAGSTGSVDLTAGEQVRFGTCRCPACRPQLVIPASSAFLAGAVGAEQDHWRLDNLSPAAVLVCHDLEDEGQRVHLAPGRLGVPLPFELARVTFRGHAESWSLTVFGPEPVQSPQRACPAASGAAPTLNRSATYFTVLRLLAAPRLAGDADARLPTSPEIVARLQHAGLRLTRRAVDHHIDYLAERFGVDGRHDGAATSARRSWRREALVQAALAADVLTVPAVSGAARTA